MASSPYVRPWPGACHRRLWRGASVRGPRRTASTCARCPSCASGFRALRRTRSSPDRHWVARERRRRSTRSWLATFVRHATHGLWAGSCYGTRCVSRTGAIPSITRQPESVDREVVGPLVGARALLADLHEHVVEQAAGTKS